MNKTDVVFYLSTLAGVGSLFVKLATNVVSANTLTWISIISALIAFIAFQFYEKINGTNTPPTPPSA